MLVVCSDIHVIWSPLISVLVTRIQDLAYEFSKICRGDIPGPQQREGATPSRIHPHLGLWTGAGRKRSGVGTETVVPSTFQPWLSPCVV